MKSNTKKIAPIELEVVTFKKLQKIIAKYSDDGVKFVSVREALVNLIDEKYEQISGSIKW
ncbi:hypothetical protein HOE22_09865 [Candidatus Woesearchaeota archaeon]|nr:hypothetical protein [Candidatus Woesearchaeota archaeon]MBT4731283.1 hypothetical protein [Candidatus Woesearchaeota archaeon]MBT7558445.1 hypothetical protein [Candidatus Woesearchaeota archaeon]